MKPETLMAFGVSQEHAEKVAAEIAQAIAANEAEDPKLTDEAIDALRDSADVVDHLTIAAEEMRAAADETDEITVDAIDVRDLVVRARREIKKLRAENGRWAASMSNAQGVMDQLQRMNRALASDLDDLMRGDLWVAVREERARQTAKWGEQNHPDVAPHDPAEPPLRAAYSYGIPTASDARNACDNAAQLGACTWAHILVEEIAELVEAATFAQQGKGPESNVDAELVQCVAVLVQWYEARRRRAPRVGYDANGTPTTETAGGAS